MANVTIKFWRATGRGLMAETFAPGEVTKIVQVTFRMSKASKESFSARHVSAAGDAFDSCYFGMGTYPHAAVRHCEPLYIDQFDSIDFSHPNPEEATWGLEVAYETYGGSQCGGLVERIADGLRESGANGGVR